jgi:hypothetical protein
MMPGLNGSWTAVDAVAQAHPPVAQAHLPAVEPLAAAVNHSAAGGLARASVTVTVTQAGTVTVIQIFEFISLWRDSGLETARPVATRSCTDCLSDLDRETDDTLIRAGH